MGEVKHCTCVADFNAKLAEHNAELVTTLFGEPKAVIETVKIDPKKRGRPPRALASYCPFCGTKYGLAALSEALGEEQ